jgi:uncharacterized protein YaiI (UPF0178 family)
MRSNGLKLNDAIDTSAWAYKMSNRSQTGSKPRDRKTRTGKSEDAVDSRFSLPTHRDQIVITQDWDVNSQSSQAKIIVEGEDGENNHHHDPWISDGAHQAQSTPS